ncbi:MAG: hypothetical protein ACLGIK_09990, partial [Gemmatimonadota bacterium]
ALLTPRLDERVARMWRLGLLDEVRDLRDRGLESGATASRAIGYAQALAHAGRPTEALREAREALALILAQGTARRSGSYSMALDLAATVAMYVGNHAAALDWLEEQRTLPMHWSSSYLRVNPYYRPLLGNPRFERLTADASQ